MRWHFQAIRTIPSSHAVPGAGRSDVGLLEIRQPSVRAARGLTICVVLIAYADRPQLRELARKHGLMMPCDSDSWRLERGNKVIT